MDLEKVIKLANKIPSKHFVKYFLKLNMKLGKNKSITTVLEKDNAKFQDYAYLSLAYFFAGDILNKVQKEAKYFINTIENTELKTYYSKKLITGIVNLKNINSNLEESFMLNDKSFLLYLLGVEKELLSIVNKLNQHLDIYKVTTYAEIEDYFMNDLQIKISEDFSEKELNALFKIEDYIIELKLNKESLIKNNLAEERELSLEEKSEKIYTELSSISFKLKN